MKTEQAIQAMPENTYCNDLDQAPKYCKLAEHIATYPNAAHEVRNIRCVQTAALAIA